MRLNRAAMTIMLTLALAALTGCGAPLAPDHIRTANLVCEAHGGMASVQSTANRVKSLRDEVEVLCNDGFLANFFVKGESA